MLLFGPPGPMHRRQIGAIVSPPISLLSQIQHHTGSLHTRMGYRYATLAIRRSNTPCWDFYAVGWCEIQMLHCCVVMWRRRRRKSVTANECLNAVAPSIVESIYFFLPDILATAAFLAASSSFCFFWKARSCTHQKPSSATQSPRLRDGLDDLRLRRAPCSASWVP